MMTTVRILGIIGRVGRAITCRGLEGFAAQAMSLLGRIGLEIH
jgi:hypothetical protein